MLRKFFLIAGLLAFMPFAAAEERITSFDSHVLVNRDGSLLVTETIALVSEQREIRRGILRDFPTDYKDSRGLDLHTGFEVVSVQRNGHDESYEVENIQRGKRIRIGDKDVFLKSGRHVYTITYRTTRQIGFFADYDELYWNVTGSSWTFPIEHASVDVSLPPEAMIRQGTAYTGAFRENGRDFSILNSKGNSFSARTTRRLAHNQGFTVAFAWQKGVIAAPGKSELMLQKLEDNAAFFLLLLSLGIVGAYYLYAWSCVGRDPEKGRIVPLFHPPKDLGPAATRYVWRQSFDERTFAAALVGLASQGWLKIFDDDDEFSIRKTPHAGAVATRPESEVYEQLGSQTLVLEQENREQVLRMREKLEDTLEKTYNGVMFNRNSAWFWAGAALSVACLLFCALFLPAGERENALFFSTFFAVFGSVFLAMIWINVKAIAQSRSVLGKLAAIFFLVFLIPFLLPFVVPLLGVAGQNASLGLLAYFGAGLMLALMNIVFLNLLYAPTKAGRWVMDEIEGFRMYLATAEEERLNALNPPEKTPELFERFLPFAIALDCENEWGKKFENVLAAASKSEKSTYSPGWYSGRSWSGGNIGTFAGGLSSSLVSSVVSASASSSSGSGGGGFSGGGGGGGGGSGW